MTYSDLVSAIQSVLVTDSSDPDLPGFLPRIIEMAEFRCYREIDFLATRKQATATLTSGTYSFAGPTDWVIGRHLYATTQAGVRSELLRRDVSFLNEYWPARATTGTLKYWCEPSFQQLLLLAPTSAQVTLEMDYTFRPTPLSGSNTTTWLSTYAPDLLLYAALIAASGWAKNFGAKSDDPTMAVSWETSYQQAKASAIAEETRRKITDPTPADVPATS